MIRSEVIELIYAYFNLPVKEYIETLYAVKKGGGLSLDEEVWLQLQTPAAHASAIIRHLSLI